MVGCGDAVEIRVMEPTALFVSHGSPMTALQGGAAGAFTSGSITHKLGWFMHDPQPMQAPVRAESAAFRHWWPWAAAPAAFMRAHSMG